MMKIGMSKVDFEKWKNDWFLNIPGCKDFSCCHELMSCAIKPLCGCGSIYETYKKQEIPLECLEVKCIDCLLRWECKKIKSDR